MFFERLTNFLCEYITIPQQYKDKSGNVSDEVIIKHCVGFLIENKVFEKEEMRKQALKDYKIIIPHCYFKGA